MNNQKITNEILYDFLKDFKDNVNRRFEQIDKQFEQIDKRFEQVDKRFEQVDKRFEQVDKRLDRLENKMDIIMDERDKVRVDFGWKWTMASFIIAIGAASIVQILS